MLNSQFRLLYPEKVDIFIFISKIIIFGSKFDKLNLIISLQLISTIYMKNFAISFSLSPFLVRGYALCHACTLCCYTGWDCEVISQSNFCVVLHLFVFQIYMCTFVYKGSQLAVPGSVERERSGSINATPRRPSFVGTIKLFFR